MYASVKKNRNRTFGYIWEAEEEECKNVSKGFNSFENSFNKPSAALRAALQA